MNGNWYQHSNQCTIEILIGRSLRLRRKEYNIEFKMFCWRSSNAKLQYTIACQSVRFCIRESQQLHKADTQAHHPLQTISMSWTHFSKQKILCSYVKFIGNFIILHYIISLSLSYIVINQSESSLQLL